MSDTPEYRLYLPKSDTVIEICLAVQAIPSVIGHNLHDYFEKSMKTLYSNWVQYLHADSDAGKVNRRDFSVLQRSWLFYPQSPLRSYLPTNQQFTNLSHRCIAHRNALAHNDGDFTAASMLPMVQDFKKFAELIGLEVSVALKELEKRMQDLVANRKWTDPNRGLSLEEAKAIFEAEFSEMLAAEEAANQEKVSVLKREIEMKEKILRAEQGQKDALEVEYQDVVREKEDLEIQIAVLQAQISAMAYVEDTDNVDRPTSGPFSQDSNATPVSTWSPFPVGGDLVKVPDGTWFSSVYPGDNSTIDSILELGRLVEAVSELPSGAFIARIKGRIEVVSALQDRANEVFDGHVHGQLTSPIGVRLPRLLQRNSDNELNGLITNRVGAVEHLEERFERAYLFRATNMGCLLGRVAGQWCCVGKFKVKR